MDIQSLNQVNLLGVVYSQPSTSNTKSGAAFSVMQVETYQQLTKANRPGKPRMRTELHNCVFYREHAAAICELGDIVGQVISIVGTIHYRKVRDESGNPTKYVEPCINVISYSMPNDELGSGDRNEFPYDPNDDDDSSY